MTAAPEKIFLIGFMGVGKSHWGARLADRLGHPYVDLDERVSANAGGRTVLEIFDQEGEEYFRQLESDTLQSLTRDYPRFVMACGGGTPCFLNNLDTMKRNGLVIWLRADAAELLPRLLAGKESRPLIRDLGPEQLESYIIRKLGDRNIYYQQAQRAVQERELNEENFMNLLLYA